MHLSGTITMDTQQLFLYLDALANKSIETNDQCVKKIV